MRPVSESTLKPDKLTPGPNRAEQVLEVTDLRTQIRVRGGIINAVDGLSFRISQGETFGVVGESGCGKSMMALSILRLLPQFAASVGGVVDFGGTDLLHLSNREMRRIRGNEICMIFQEPMTSLNPVKTIGSQITEVLALHQRLPHRAAMDRAYELLDMVNISEARSRLADYPHQLSGGMRQRVMIAMAIACNPKVLLADEPTTALDVTIQAQIMELMGEIQQRLGTAIILITHDLALVAEQADRIMVMYTGRKVEEANVEELFERPCHPYTLGLLGSVPRLGSSISSPLHRRRLQEIPGSVPSLQKLPQGCTFADRCPFAADQCRQQFPPLEEKLPGHWAACWRTEQVLDAAS
jgi:peptide/nickel transport system ATP-binding protein